MIRHPRNGGAAGRSTPRDGVGGFSLVEMLVVVLISFLLLGAAWSVLARQRKAVENLVVRSEWLASARVARWSLRRDLLSAARVPALAEDTVSLRALRGWALPCSSVPTRGGDMQRAVAVRYRGIRRPDPRKDSLKILDASGQMHVAGLREVRPEPACTDGSGALGLWLRPESVSVTGVYLELFERGSYHLQGGALRYRSAAGYRQPLTVENIHRDSRFDPVTGDLTLRARGLERVWTLSSGALR